ncbi:MAG TPA: carboxypeptidase regulatory-like domain-containing protein [Pyrinomonadaceae bacterium]|nr:carboxypeptidase regulatory-like domain-containing protein [Pyrinomonadaceae bacterium]
MKFPLRLALLLTVVFSGIVIGNGQAPGKESTASVAGRVTISGKAAPGVVVVASLSASFFDSKTAAKTVTDEDGNYKLTGLTAGKFTIFPLAKSYVGANNGAFKVHQSVNIAEGEAITKIDFPLVRGGVVTGRITDAEGHPLIGERVNVAIKGSEPDAGPQMPMLGAARNQTDDRGIYRVYGLAPGIYTVSVGQAASASAVSIMGMSGSQYLKTYYPSVQDENGATAIEIKEGSEIKDVDITVAKPDAGHSVAGRVVDEAGQPVPNVYIAHSSVNESAQMGAMNFTGNQSDANGKFKLEGLRAGRYAVYTMQAGAGSTSTYSEPTTFEISDSDVTGIEIKVRHGASVNGVAVIDNGDQSASALLQTVTLYSYVEQKGMGAPSYGTSPIAADGSFHFTGLAPGKVRMGIQGFPTPPKGLSLVRTELDGVDQPDGIETTAGAEIKGVRLVFAYGTGLVRGIVTTENGPPADGMTLQVMVRSASGDSRRLRRQTDLDARLQFVIENLPPGDYELIVRGVGPVTEGKPPVPVDFLKQTVTVSNGSETKVNLVVDLKKGPQP